jgi:hypothetical protein
MRSETEEFSLFLSQVRHKSVRVFGSTGKMTSFNFSGRVDNESTRCALSVRGGGFLTVLDFSKSTFESVTGQGIEQVWVLVLSPDSSDTASVTKIPD